MLVALRSLCRTPAFLATALLSIGLSVGAAATAFGVIDAVRFRALPFKNGERLVLLSEVAADLPGRVAPAGSCKVVCDMPYITYDAMRLLSFRTLDVVAAYSSGIKTMDVNGDPVPVLSGVVSENLFDLLDVKPTLGRGFVAADNHVGAEDMATLGPFLPLATQLGRLAMELAEGSSVERIEAAFLGRIADFDTRLLGLAVIVGALQGRTEEQVNLVNAPTMAQQRGIVFEEKAVSEAQDFNELIRVTVIAGGERVAVAGTGIGPNGVPHLVEVQGRRLTIELEPNVTIFRYEDLPGMIGRVGTIFGAHGINISSAAVGHTPDGHGDRDDKRLAAMVVTTDAPVPDGVLKEIVASEGVVNGWSVNLR